MNARPAMLVPAVVAAALAFAPAATADDSGFPDVSGYTAADPGPFQRGGYTTFRTPDGLLCGMKGARVWCHGALPAVPQGVDTVTNSSFTRWAFLPDDAATDPPVLTAGHSLTVTGAQTVSTCVVGDGGSTACRYVLTGATLPQGTFTEEKGFLLSPQGSRVWQSSGFR